MPDLNPPSSEREEALNLALEALHFAFRAIVAQPDACLAEQGLSRVHHRILYFIAHRPGGSVADLLAVLGVSKQSLHEPLRRLAKLGYVESSPDPADRRVKRLALTETGQALEAALSGHQRQRFAQAFSAAGPEAEAAWRRVMGLLAKG